MIYHTGTSASSSTTHALSTQYRHIEGMWDNAMDWLDGCYYNENGLNIILSPGDFDDAARGFLIGMPSSGYMSALTVSNSAPYPTAANGSSATYISDSWEYASYTPNIYCGGCSGKFGMTTLYNSKTSGLFHLGCNGLVQLNNFQSDYIGCRLMKLP